MEPVENEATRLTEARQVVKQQAFQMKRALVQQYLILTIGKPHEPRCRRPNQPSLSTYAPSRV